MVFSLIHTIETFGWNFSALSSYLFVRMACATKNADVQHFQSVGHLHLESNFPKVIKTFGKFVYITSLLLTSPFLSPPQSS